MGLRNDGIRTVEDLKARCWIDADTGHWHYRGAHDSNGKPSIWSPALRRTVSLGILACVLKTGKGPEKGQAWHTTCGMPDCANPKHRVCGNRSSQMLQAGLTRPLSTRAKIAKGKRGTGRLSEADMQEIQACGLSLREICERWKISTSYASQVRSNSHRRARIGTSVFDWRPT